MSFIDATYFTGNINIPDNPDITLTAYITKYEREILIHLLGYEERSLHNIQSR